VAVRIVERSNRTANSWRLAVAVVAAWLALVSAGFAQNCTITGGTNYGTITQNCVINPAPAPLSLITDKFKVIPMPDGTFQHQIIVRIGQPMTLFAAACGDGVLDVGASPEPAGMVAVSQKMTKDDCVAHRFFNTAPGRWAMWVTSRAADTKFTFQPNIEP
jgi:hypothetical protein